MAAGGTKLYVPQAAAYYDDSFLHFPQGEAMIRFSFLASCAYRSEHGTDINRGALPARVGDIASVVAVPIGTAADGAVVFHSIALSRLQLRVGKEHDHAVATTTRSWPSSAATRKLWALIGADDRAVRLEYLDGIAGLCVDFQCGLCANVLRGVAGAAARAYRGAPRDFKLIVVAVEALFRRTCAVGDVETTIDEHGAVGVGAVVTVAVDVIHASVNGNVLGCIYGIVFH